MSTVERNGGVPRPAGPRALGVGVLAFLTVAISACGASPPASKTPPRTYTFVLHELESIPGVSRAQLTGGSDGLPGQVSSGASPILAPGYSNDRSALLDYVLKLLWSQNVSKPSTKVTVDLRIADPAADPIDLTADGRALGLTNDGPVGFVVRSGQMKKHYGSWPRSAPTLPTSLDSPPSTAAPTPAP